jgi:soluble lytic murein transglycosylase-like protein
MKHVGAELAPAQYNNTGISVDYLCSFRRHYMRFYIGKTRFIALFALLTLLLSAFLLMPHEQPDAYAANQETNGACNWYNIRSGDTLNYIARTYHTTSGVLARVNHIANINIIFVGQHLCVANKTQYLASRVSNGLLANGAVRWYAYNALDYSSQSQAVRLLRGSAVRYGLPANLLLAIAWQESGWRQHIIARDGGIGIMQLMPYTAMGLNAQTRIHFDPYKLADNIALGAIYLHSLWRGLHGNLTSIISAYNEGGWNVVHRGIFNWRYVSSVLALMRRF